MQRTCAHCQRLLEFSGEPPRFCGYCGKPFADSPAPDTEALAQRAEAPTMPEQVGGYRLLRPLGAGGMGTVYEAEEVASGRRVALKLIAPEVEAGSAAVARFVQEGRLASRISHPHCVFVLAADQDAGRPYLVMELMPGETLEDLAARQGPLPPAQAVGLMLDVIAGLQEAHRHGVIHRDVKPSNCFLTADGRVKVGDFGLAKSLLSEVKLSQSGVFVGTLLFAAPEQVRGEPVNEQTDVYAVAATLFYLLTGQAPFQAADAAATLARIVADEAPSLRRLRPDMPEALDAAVRQGLERDRGRRWRDLEAFRLALLPFVAPQPGWAVVGRRFGGHLIDWFLLAVVGGLGQALVSSLLFSDEVEGPGTHPLQWAYDLLNPLAWVAYFALTEWRFGGSPGKLLLRLRVTNLGGKGPSLGQAVGRAVVYYALVWVTGDFLMSPLGEPNDAAQAMVEFFWRFPLACLSLVLGVGLLALPMRPRNGYRMLHDWLSGTRVLPLRWSDRPARLEQPRKPEVVALPAGGSVGPYEVRGRFPVAGASEVLAAHDPALDRPVWVWRRPAGSASLSAARGAVSRPTRLRWLAAGRQDERPWEAYLAPSGRPLRTFLDGAPSPAALGTLLHRLTEELEAGLGDGTLPPTLGLAQVWVADDGTAVLLDFPLEGTAEEGGQGGGKAQALAFLKDVARSVRASLPMAGAPLPRAWTSLLARLSGEGEPIASLRALSGELRLLVRRPAAVTRTRRAVQTILLTMLLTPGLFACMAPSGLLDYMPIAMLGARVDQTDRVSARLEQSSRVVLAVGLVNPDALGRLGALGGRHVDLGLRQRLDSQGDVHRTMQTARLEAVSPLTRAYALAVTPQVAPKLDALLRPALGFREEASTLAGWPPLWQPRFEAWVRLAVSVQVCLWPALWVVMAFVFRGGLSFRMVEIEVVRPDSRPASRWQCALRALAVWLPVTALLLASVWLWYWYWATWPEGGGYAGVLTASWVLWGLGLGLLPLYGVVALWSPTRPLQDRLAGTWLAIR
jgi:hypothetical protein